MSKQQVLIIDDEPDIRELLEITLGRMNLITHTAKDVASAMKLLNSREFDLCLTDMHLPDGTGLEILGHIQANIPNLPVAVITAFGSMETAIESLKLGAFDFISKPVDLQRLREIVQNALKLNQTPIKDIEKDSSDYDGLLGQSEVMLALKQKIKKLSRSQAPVFINGPSGSGKELVASLIHTLGSRADQPFIPVNCGAIPSELMESEFFGHKKGAFTGANEAKQGFFQAAHGGTLFLDEVADLPLAMQVKLLRVIQEKAVRPVGENNEVPVDVRILSATHKNLLELIEQGDFRQDLYYRINVIDINVPPLHERGCDIALLTDYFLEKLSENYQLPKVSLSAEAKLALDQYSFPGNVRQLENILERAYTLCEDDIIELEDLNLEDNVIAAKPTAVVKPIEPIINVQPEASNNEFPIPDDIQLEPFLESIERRALAIALEKERWNKTAAAKRLGITFRALRYRLKKLEME
ncbi:sigma-54-dependent transcriptional regulator [Marinicellulosiphila megalodicopiae]|uniref:sigma-54-dependent transcriptional regulator n=1 Tax=Marinicellulosiphila megalodicopiae TaxID=2724896 RepID=UPI003BB187B9